MMMMFFERERDAFCCLFTIHILLVSVMITRLHIFVYKCNNTDSHASGSNFSTLNLYKTSVFVDYEPHSGAVMVDARRWLTFYSH